MHQRIIQEFTEVPKMSKWNNIELTPNNVFDYVQQLDEAIRKYESSRYYKVYFDSFQEDELINHTRIDSSEFDDIKKYLCNQVLECEENECMLKNKEYKKLLQNVQAYNKLFEDKIIVTPVDIINIELTNIDNSYSEINNISEINTNIKYELELRQLTNMGYGEIYNDIKNSSVFERLINGTSTEVDKTLLRYLQQNLGQKTDTSDFDLEQKNIYNEFRLTKDSDIRQVYSKINNIVVFGTERDKMIEQLHELGLEVDETVALVDDGFEGLTYNLIQEQGDFVGDDILINQSYDNTGYFINTILVDDVPIVVDLHQSKVFKTIDQAMKHFSDLNKAILINNFKEFYQENSDEILFESYEESFISDLVSQYFGFDIAKFRDQELNENSTILKNQVIVNKLIDDVYEELRDITIFENGYFSPIADEDGNFELEVDSGQMLLTFDIKITDTSKSLAYKIANEFLEQYEHSEANFNSLDVKCEQLRIEFKALARNDYQKLHEIGVAVTGASGINFEEFEDYYDNYCDISKNKMDMTKYINDVLNTFIELYDNEDKQEKLSIIEITNRYCNQTNLSVDNFITNINLLSSQVVTDEVAELVSPNNDYFNQALNVDITGYTTETKNQVINAIEHELKKYYEQTHIDVGQVYFIDDIYNDVDFGIWNNYKFIDSTLKYCIANIDYFDHDLDITSVFNHLERLEADLGIVYTHERELLELVQGNIIPRYGDGQGIEQELFEQITYLAPNNDNFTTGIEIEHKSQLNKVMSAINDYMTYIHSTNLDLTNSFNGEDFEQIFSKHSVSELTEVQLEILMEKTLTTCLRNSEKEINQFYMGMKSFEASVNIQFDQINNFIESPKEYTVIQQFEYIIATATLEDNEQSNHFLTNMKQYQYPLIKHLFDTNLEQLQQSTLAYIELENNKFNVSEQYIQHFNQVIKGFEQYENLSTNSQLQECILSNPYIKHNLLVGLPLSSGEKQLLELANKSTGQTVMFNEVEKLDKRNLNIANQIIEHLDLKRYETFERHSSIECQNNQLFR